MSVWNPLISAGVGFGLDALFGGDDDPAEGAIKAGEQQLRLGNQASKHFFQFYKRNYEPTAKLEQKEARGVIKKAADRTNEYLKGPQRVGIKHYGENLKGSLQDIESGMDTLDRTAGRIMDAGKQYGKALGRADDRLGGLDKDMQGLSREAQRLANPRFGRETRLAGAKVDRSFRSAREAEEIENARRGITPGSGASLALGRQGDIAQAGARASAMNEARAEERKRLDDVKMRSLGFRAGALDYRRGVTGMRADLAGARANRFAPGFSAQSTALNARAQYPGIMRQHGTPTVPFTGYTTNVSPGTAATYQQGSASGWANLAANQNDGRTEFSRMVSGIDWGGIVDDVRNRTDENTTAPQGAGGIDYTWT